MSMNQDNSPKFKFVHSNLYQIFGSDKKVEKPLSKSLVKSVIIKAQDLLHPTSNMPTIRPFVYNEIVRKGEVAPNATRAPLLAQPTEISQVATEMTEENTTKMSEEMTTENATASRAPVMLNGIKENLKALKELHARFRFVLKELEELVQD